MGNEEVKITYIAWFLQVKSMENEFEIYKGKEEESRNDIKVEKEIVLHFTYTALSTDVQVIQRNVFSVKHNHKANICEKSSTELIFL
jgi:hypothetical protein